jgi:hypothetical protein
LNNFDKKGSLRKFIEDIASQRVNMVNELIEAYHRKSEIALNMLPPPQLPKNEKLYEIKETMNSYSSLPK